MTIKELFGHPKIIIECDSGSNMLAVAETAINELQVENGSDTIRAVRDHPKDSQTEQEFSDAFCELLQGVSNG